MEEADVLVNTVELESVVTDSAVELGSVDLPDNVVFVTEVASDVPDDGFAEVEPGSDDISMVDVVDDCNADEVLSSVSDVVDNSEAVDSDTVFVVDPEVLSVSDELVVTLEMVDVCSELDVDVVDDTESKCEVDSVSSYVVALTVGALDTFCDVDSLVATEWRVVVGFDVSVETNVDSVEISVLVSVDRTVLNVDVVSFDTCDEVSKFVTGTDVSVTAVDTKVVFVCVKVDAEPSVVSVVVSSDEPLPVVYVVDLEDSTEEVSRVEGERDPVEVKSNSVVSCVESED